MSRSTGRVAAMMLAVIGATLTLTLTSCREDDAVQVGGAPGSAGNDAARWQEEQFNWPVENLNRIEEFDSGELLQKILARLKTPEGEKTDAASVASQRDPLLATWPEPEVLRQAIERLNQWLAAGRFPGEWASDPLLKTLPEQLAELPMLRDLGEMKFTRYDEYALLETVWLRDVSTWARGEEIDDLSRAQKLFDWTIRNIAWIPPGGNAAAATPLVPWESLFFGNGTPLERAWVFILLARQQGLDAVMLGIDDVDAASGKPPRPWAVAVLIDGKAYLFDAELGLPLPAPNGVSKDESGQLAIRPATLEEVVADAGLLGRLDADGKHPYRVSSEDLKRVVALVEASPPYLSKRMRIFESKLAGQRKMVLATDATAQAERWKAVPHVTDARLWQHPYQTLVARLNLNPAGVQERLAALLPFYASGTSQSLRRGRMLYLKGRFQGEPGAIEMFQAARPSNEELRELHQKLAVEIQKNTEQAVPEEERTANSAQIKAYANKAAAMQVMLLLRIKQDASYWLGLISYQTGSMQSAVDYFSRRTILAFPDGFWTLGARYNLGRALEAIGESQKAVEFYRSMPDAPDYAGLLLRSKWLSEVLDHPK